jgi:hypothetical protein
VRLATSLFIRTTTSHSVEDGVLGGYEGLYADGNRPLHTAQPIKDSGP